MEKVFQSNSRAKHRFIKMVYLSACQGEQDVDPLVQYLKSQLGVCISLAECRQLILYSSLFGDTSSTSIPLDTLITQTIYVPPASSTPLLGWGGSGHNASGQNTTHNQLLTSSFPGGAPLLDPVWGGFLPGISFTSPHSLDSPAPIAKSVLEDR
jgi:hypothetical protein